MTSRKNILIIGATSSIAEHCARLWLKKDNVNLTLVGRNTEKLNTIAADLNVRSPGSQIKVISADFIHPEKINSLVKEIVSGHKTDIALIAQGSLSNQESCQEELQKCADALSINGISPILFAEAFAHKFEKCGGGTIAMIGSVAGDRGRKSNYIYGAAKAMVSAYAEGMQHRFAASNVKVILIKPGPTATPMTQHLVDSGIALAPVEQVALEIVTGIEKGSPVIYTPKKWRLIMFIVGCIPNFIFHRLNI